MTGRSRGPLGQGGGDAGRPHCINCRRPMQTMGARRFKCPRCAVSVTRQTRAVPWKNPEARPWCVVCRLVMRAAGARKFRCAGCNVWIVAHPQGRPRRRELERPACPVCGHPQAVESDGRGWRCQRCKRRRRVEREPERREADAARLLASMARRLPGYLTPDEREDAAQSIMLDVLAGNISPEGLTPLVLRRYAAEARGMTSDRYRFISLSAPTRDGREFGDTLAA